MKSFRILTLCAGAAALMAAALVGAPGAHAQSATASAPYTLTVFPGTPPAGVHRLSKPSRCTPAYAARPAR